MARIAIVVTALPVEFAAVADLLTGRIDIEDRAGTIYSRGSIRGWEVTVAEIGAGNVNAAARIERLIAFVDPRPEVALFVGVAGGVKDVALGDVVAATKIYGYESGKDMDDRFRPRPDVGKCTYRLIERARAVARSHPKGLFRVHLGPIAAGEKVVAGNKSPTARFLRDQYGDALAVEMEGRGFLASLEAHPNIDALVIRGISDLLGAKSKADAGGSQTVASKNAAAIAAKLLPANTGRKRTAGPPATMPSEVAPTEDSQAARGKKSVTATEAPGVAVARRWRFSLEGTVSDLTAIDLQGILASLSKSVGDAQLTIDSVQDGSIILQFKTSSTEDFSNRTLDDASIHLYGYRLRWAESAGMAEHLAVEYSRQRNEKLDRLIEQEIMEPSPHYGDDRFEGSLSKRLAQLVERLEVSKQLAGRLRFYLREQVSNESGLGSPMQISLASQLRFERLSKQLEKDFAHHIIWHSIGFGDEGNTLAAIAVCAPDFDYEYQIFVSAVKSFNKEAQRREQEAGFMPLVSLREFVEVLLFRWSELRRVASDSVGSSHEWRWPILWGDIHFNGPVSPGHVRNKSAQSDMERLARAIRRYKDVLDKNTVPPKGRV